MTIFPKMGIQVLPINDFFRKLKGSGFVLVGALISTIDVVGLYPHIPHCEGLEALRKAIDKGNVRVTTGHLVNLARLKLENNFFEFNGKVYLQKLGTAICTMFSPTFAWETWEECFLETCVYHPWVWWRFLDDVFVVWLHDREMLENFLGALN